MTPFHVRATIDHECFATGFNYRAIKVFDFPATRMAASSEAAQIKIWQKMFARRSFHTDLEVLTLKLKTE